MVMRLWYADRESDADVCASRDSASDRHVHRRRSVATRAFPIFEVEKCNILKLPQLVLVQPDGNQFPAFCQDGYLADEEPEVTRGDRVSGCSYTCIASSALKGLAVYLRRESDLDGLVRGSLGLPERGT